MKGVKEAWNSIPEELIIKSFKKCGNSNAMNGTEDDMVYENLVASSTEKTENEVIDQLL